MNKQEFGITPGTYVATPEKNSFTRKDRREYNRTLCAQHASGYGSGARCDACRNKIRK